MSITLKQLTEQYQEIGNFINDRWPLKNKEQRIFARTMKVVEELGELADEILTSMNLQRESKIAKFSKKNVEDEMADVMASMILLAAELDINLDKIMKKKIKYTRDRFEINSES
jgi:NTP pyrophosphatase (non-canonical NTP hydrolase)